MQCKKVLEGLEGRRLKVGGCLEYRRGRGGEGKELPKIPGRQSVPVLVR